MIWGIRIARGVSAAVELCAVLLLLSVNDVRAMIRINGLLGLVGPLIFVTVSALGLAAGMGKIQPGRLAMIFAGVVLVLLGTRS